MLKLDVRFLLLFYHCMKCKDTILQGNLVTNIDVSSVFIQNYGFIF